MAFWKRYGHIIKEIPVIIIASFLMFYLIFATVATITMFDLSYYNLAEWKPAVRGAMAFLAMNVSTVVIIFCTIERW